MMEDNFLDIQKNSKSIELEFAWLKEIIMLRLNDYFKNDSNSELKLPGAPDITQIDSKYSRWIIENQLSELDRVIIISSLANIYFPEIFDNFLIKNKGLNKRFTEFGGKIDSDNSRFIPSLETISFILFGKSYDSTFKFQSILESDHILNKISAIRFHNNVNDSSLLSKTFSLNESVLQLITVGKKYSPNFSSSFPARLLETDLDWDELILAPIIMDEVENINTWIQYKNEIAADKVLVKKINKGFKCLFYGPPGTGKTLTASLLGKRNKQDVYRVDLSQMISKYVGETEKNLAQIFNIAENKDWILFFDEAESLFSKRTSVSDSKDKFANQQTAYLLQRIEDYTGIVVLATNLKPNIDRAFGRRLQSQINFTIPAYKERRVLWRNALSGLSDVGVEIVNYLAKEFTLSGGSIKNVIQYAWLVSKRRNCKIGKNELLMGIRRELSKDGKTIEV